MGGWLSCTAGLATTWRARSTISPNRACAISSRELIAHARLGDIVDLARHVVASPAVHESQPPILVADVHCPPLQYKLAVAAEAPFFRRAEKRFLGHPQ